MSGTPVEIHWFPRYCERFVTWGSEINLYQVRNTEDVDHRVSTSASQYLNTIVLINIYCKSFIQNIFFFAYFRHKFGYIASDYRNIIGIRDTISIHTLRSTVIPKFRRFAVGRRFGQWKSWIM